MRIPLKSMAVILVAYVLVISIDVAIMLILDSFVAYKVTSGINKHKAALAKLDSIDARWIKIAKEHSHAN